MTASEKAGNASQAYSDTASEDSDLPPPAYGKQYGQIDTEQGGGGTRARIGDDGRVNIRIDQQTKGLSSLLVPALRSQLDLTAGYKGESQPYVPPTLARASGRLPPPPLNVVIHVVGSRGDVQPFVALGKVLKEEHGHRVRLATHPVFKTFVEDNGLEFFSIGGDPSELMAFMVKNPGLMPGFDTMRRGDIGRRRKEIGIMIKGCWRSCIEPGDGSGVEMSDKNAGDWANFNSQDGHETAPRPFIADAIIANPPSFAHIHCAEKLGIPLHMMFTMPWSPTQSFPHPLANIQSTNADANMTNFISYALVDMMTWQGLGDIINRFRQRSLALDPISFAGAPGMLARLHVPYTYCWSPALIPKPRDWAPFISISGFYFLSSGSSFTPESELAAFLKAGPPPVYIGFGSIVVDDPNAMTKLIFDAVKQSGQRALVSKGWGGVGADQIGIPEGIFMLGNVPHDWLFKHVSCVVHHGGAGTTAAGIAAGKPTVIIPFFGDQPFWGAMVAKAGAGPDPIAYKDLNANSLATSIAHALKSTTLEKAKEMAIKISKEKGTASGASSFHQELDIDRLRCQFSPTRAAVWRIRRTELRLSAFAATALSMEGLLNFKDLKLYRPREHEIEDGPPEPISGGASALVGTLGSMAMGVADLPVAALKALQIHPDAPKKNKTRSDPIAKSPKPSQSTSSAGTETPQSSSDMPHSDIEMHDGEDELRSSTRAKSASNKAETSRSESPPQQNAEIAQAIGSQMAAASKRDENETLQDSSSEAASDEKKPFGKDDVESMIGTGKGAFRIAGAGIKSPMDFTLNLAKGFRNAPKLYGDDTVRKADKVTDFESGIRTAGKEFGLGFYDGITGLVTQPLEGLKKEGAAGFFKGFGKGLGGVVFKPGAAIWGIPGYTSQGIYKELYKRLGPSTENFIVAARTAQGYEDLNNASAEEKAAVIADWKELRRFIHKNKNIGEDHMERLQIKIQELRQNKKTSDSKVERHPLDRTVTGSTTDSGVYSPDDSEMVQNPLSRNNTNSADASLEQAIHDSVAETSRGNAVEDAQIERAIRASVAELRRQQSQGAGDVDIQKAMQASIEDAKRGRLEPEGAEIHAFDPDEDEEHNDEMQKALDESRRLHQVSTSQSDKSKQEEEIVMQYMMKQSAAEEELRKKRAGA